MSSLFVYQASNPDLPTKVLNHFEDIASTLAEQAVGFERLPVGVPVTPGVSQEEVITACHEQFDRLMTERGHVRMVVVSASVRPGQHSDAHGGLLEEHRHGDDQTYYFVSGRGLLSLHIDDHVFAVSCEKHDLISVPAGMRRWFDEGEQPHVVVVRFSTASEDTEPHFTGDDIARRFPRFED